MSTACVTGASAGLGRAFAHELAERGHDLVLVARDRARLEDLSDELTRRHRISVEVLAADLSDRAQVQRVADRVGSLERPVDLLVNNAGFGMPQGFVRGELADEEAGLAVMVTAVLVLSHAAARAMRSRGHGAVLNVASVAAFSTLGSYAAVKAWCLRFTEVLASELRGSGVTATALCPGLVRTEFHERAGMRMGRVPDLAWLSADRVVTDALSDVARGRVVSVPSRRYRALVTLMRATPTGLSRPVTSRLAQLRRGR